MKKQKKITWHESVKDSTKPVQFFSKKIKLEKTGSSDVLNQFTKLQDSLEFGLQENYIDLILFKLSLLKKDKALFVFLKCTDYKIFNLALQAKKLEIINYFFENLDERQL